MLEIAGTDGSTNPKILILPALFDEANKLRRQTVQIIRSLDEMGIASILPDLPGMNESLAPLDEQSLTQWRADAIQVAEQFGASHVLSIRGGALIAPDTLPGWHYAPIGGARILRGMLRARVLVSKEAGREESTAQLSELGAKEGIELAGWRFGAEMFGELQNAEPAQAAQQSIIAQSDIGGAALWLRAEADDDDAQAKALASIIADSLAKNS
ncbi:MAG: hypothetical protein ABJP34_08235 [Erythrobacter sp.]